MTMYNCDNCNKWLHISKLGEIEKEVNIGELTIYYTFRLCKTCLKRAKIKYKIEDYFITLLGTKEKHGKI